MVAVVRSALTTKKTFSADYKPNQTSILFTVREKELR